MKLSKNYSIPANIILVFLVLIFALLMVIGLNNVYTKEKENSLSIMANVEDNIALINLTHEMNKIIVHRTHKFNDLIESKDPFEQDDLHMEINELSTQFTLLREKLVNSDLVLYQQSVINSMSSLIKVINQLEQKVIELIQNDKPREAKEIYYKSINSRRFQNFISLYDLANYNERLNYELIKKSQQSTDESFATIAWTGIFSLLSTFIFGLLIFFYQYRNTNIQKTLANIDSLTKLPNRKNFISNINQKIKTDEKPFSIVFIDIDYFKSINDNYGHSVGDMVLKNFVKVINDNIGKSDFLSRFGGDEFVLMINDFDNSKELENRLIRLSKSLDTSFKIGDSQIYISSSMGASVYPRDGVDDKTLLKNADLAMYQAKSSGRNCYRIYSQKLENTYEKEKYISHALHTMVNNNKQKQELSMQYQLFHNCKDKTCIECEALIRWTTPTGDVIPTDYFISIAEKSNLIENINLFVIDEVCEFQFKRKNLGLANLRININLSGNKESFLRVLEYFENKIKSMDMLYSNFGIELTERTVLDASKKTIAKLLDFKNKDIKISLDDFGTGYSSLSNLKKLPITTIKIDKSFIAGLPKDEEDQQLVNTIITLAHTMNLEVVGEGVENQQQYKYLRDNDCDVLQGFYLYKPVSEKNLLKESLLKAS